MRGLIQTAFDEGYAEGLAQSIAESMERRLAWAIERGIRRGKAGMLTSQLTRRFGVIPKHAMERIKSADSQTLDRWSLRVLEGQNLDTLFDEPLPTN